MATKRVLVWMLADQLRVDHPALRAAEELAGRRDSVRVAIVESLSWMRRLPFHRKRQVLILSAGRHAAEELIREGFQVDRIGAKNSREGLARLVKRHRPSRVVSMAAAEYAPRAWQVGPMSEELGVPVEILPNTMFLVGRFNPIPDPEPGRRYVMEPFYRAMRKQFALLIEPGGGPTSGTWNLDSENRKRLPKGIRIPSLPRFEPDEITRTVMGEVEASGFGVGSVEGFEVG